MKFFRSLRRGKSVKGKKGEEQHNVATLTTHSSAPPVPQPPPRPKTATSESAPARIPGPILPSPKERPPQQRRVVSDRTHLHPQQRQSYVRPDDFLKPFEFGEVVDRYPRAYLSPRTEFTSATLHGNRNSGVFNYDDASVVGIGMELGRTKSMRSNNMNDYRPDMSGRGEQKTERPGAPPGLSRVYSMIERRDPKPKQEGEQDTDGGAESSAMTFSGQDPRRHTAGYLSPMPPMPQQFPVRRQSPVHGASPHLTPRSSRQSSPHPPQVLPDQAHTPPPPPGISGLPHSNSAPQLHLIPRNQSANSLHQPTPLPRNYSHGQLHQGPPGPPNLARRPSRRMPMPPNGHPASYGPPAHYGPPPQHMYMPHPPHHNHPQYYQGPPPQRMSSRRSNMHMHFHGPPPPQPYYNSHSGGPPSPHTPRSSRPNSSPNPTVSHLPDTLPDLPESQQTCMNLHLQFLPIKLSKTHPPPCELCSRSSRSLSSCSSCHLRLCADCKLLVKTAGDIKGVEEMVAIIRAEEREREASESSAAEGTGESVGTGSSGRSSWVGEVESKKSRETLGGKVGEKLGEKLEMPGVAAAPVPVAVAA